MYKYSAPEEFASTIWKVLEDNNIFVSVAFMNVVFPQYIAARSIDANSISENWY